MSNSRAGSTTPNEASSRVAEGLRAARRVARPSLAPASRSVLVRISRSATATCLTDSGCRASVPRPLTASTVATTPASARRSDRPASLISACRMGAGSASPLVSMTTRSNGATRPSSRRRRISSSVSTRSPRTAQHRQPVCSSTKLSSLVSIRSWSSPTSPNSLMMTAVREKSGCLQQASQQRGLAAAEEAGQHGDGDHGAHERQRRDAQPHRPVARIDCGPHVAQETAIGGERRACARRRPPSTGTAGLPAPARCAGAFRRPRRAARRRPRARHRR